MKKSKNIIVKGLTINITQMHNDDYISLTDIARNKNAEEPKDVVKNWMRSRTTIEFLGLWEQINDADFKGVEFDTFLFEAEAILLLFPLPNGLRLLMPGELSQRPEIMEELLLIRI